jgi:hemerythrin-like domain-containing protein
MEDKIGKFVDEYVELKHHSREEAIALFSYIRLLFQQGREEEIVARFL